MYKRQRVEYGGRIYNTIRYLKPQNKNANTEVPQKVSKTVEPVSYTHLEGNAVTAPGQAESWEKAENEDGTVTYTVKLRDGIKWSDGQAVTAGDFVYAWQRLANPETAADYCYMIDMVKGYDAVADGSADPSTLGITAVDDQTLQIDLTYDCPYSIHLIIIVIIKWNDNTQFSFFL